MDNDNNTTGSDLEQKKSYHTKALHLAIIQDNSENDYSKLKKKYVNGEKKLDEFDELVESFLIFEKATNAYIEHIEINEEEYNSNIRFIQRLESDIDGERKYLAQQDLEQQKKKADLRGGKRKTKGKSKKVAKKPVVSQKKQSIYKEILGKQMKIYKMPDSRKEYVKYKGDLLHISDYKDLMKPKAKPKPKK